MIRYVLPEFTKRAAREEYLEYHQNFDRFRKLNSLIKAHTNNCTAMDVARSIRALKRQRAKFAHDETILPTSSSLISHSVCLFFSFLLFFFCLSSNKTSFFLSIHSLFQPRSILIQEIFEISVDDFGQKLTRTSTVIDIVTVHSNWKTVQQRLRPWGILPTDFLLVHEIFSFNMSKQQWSVHIETQWRRSFWLVHHFSRTQVELNRLNSKISMDQYYIRFRAFISIDFFEWFIPTDTQTVVVKSNCHVYMTFEKVIQDKKIVIIVMINPNSWLLCFVCLRTREGKRTRTIVSISIKYYWMIE